MQQEDKSEKRSQDAVKGRPVLSRAEATPSTISSFSIDAKGNLSPCDEDHAISRRGGGRSFWIDAAVHNERNVEELHSIIDKLDLSPFLQRHLSKPQQIRTPQVLALHSSALIVVRILPVENTSKEMQYAVALCLKDLLLTVTVYPENSKAAAAGRLLSQKTLSYMQQIELPENSTSGAAAVWMMYHVSTVAHALNKIRTQIFDLNDIMEKDVASVDLSQITCLRDELLRVLAVAEEQLQCIESVAEGESITSGLDFSKLRGSLGLLLSTAGSTERMALRLEKRMDDCRHLYDAHQQDRTNYRLSVLTIFSAVFMPITLMAGSTCDACRHAAFAFNAAIPHDLNSAPCF